MSLQSDKKMSDIPSHVDAKADDAASAAATSQAETATKSEGNPKPKAKKKKVKAKPKYMEGTVNSKINVDGADPESFRKEGAETAKRTVERRAPPTSPNAVNAKTSSAASSTPATAADNLNIVTDVENKTAPAGLANPGVSDTFRIPSGSKVSNASSGKSAF